MRRTTVLGVAIVLCSTWLSGCGSQDPVAPGRADAETADASVEEASAEAEAGEDASVGQCGVTYTDPACGACMDERCCDQTLESVMVPETLEYEACLAQCPQEDNDCQLQCAISYPEGYARYRPWVSCMLHECTEPCAGTEAESCGIRLSDASCNACAQQRCCEEMYEAYSSADGCGLEACQLGCAPSDSACLGGCIGDHPTGFAGLVLFNTCIEIECTDECEAVVGGRYPCGDPWLAAGVGTCATCLNTRCCEELAARNRNEDYWLYQACKLHCGTDMDCQIDCKSSHIEGSAISNVFKGCVGTRCPNECAATGYVHCGGMTTNTVSCTECMNDACCEEWANLGMSLQGGEYIICRSACSSQPTQWDIDLCRMECLVAYPDGYVLDQVSDVCQGNHCAEECNVTPLPCGIKFDADSPCGACVETSCCPEARVCGAEFDCARIDLCRYLTPCEPTDTACLETCKSANPAGAPAFDALMACEAASCAAECLGP